MQDQLAGFVAAIADRYRVEREVGRGGMATVLLAHDVKHDRAVAIKVLNPDLTSSIGAQRFQREIAIAARLTHPHILPLHDSGDADGLLFYVMPYVAGESLRERLDREGPLPMDDAIAILRQAAGGLAHAHAAGVVHRDVKPDNILLTDGHAAIADFGIARVLDVLGSDRITATGLTTGTPSYMSPEQAAGEPSDGRADVYSLACVAYEMLGGQPPFIGPNARAIIARHAVDSVPPLRTIRPAIPAAVDLVLARALAKNPVDRFEKPTDFVEALGRAFSGDTIGSAARVALVVLPFRSLSRDPEHEFLADGLTEEMIGQLGRLHPQRLGVIARTSAMRYKQSDKTVEEIARELAVDYVLEGSVRREADRVRVSAQLIQARDQMQLWSESYERLMGGVMALQSEVARGVAAALALKLLPAERARLAERARVNADAYEAYLKGSFHWYKLTPQDVESAMRYFELAREKDPDYALAYVGLTNVFAGFMAIGAMSPRDARAHARPLLNRALALDAARHETHHLLATFTTWVDWDWTEGEAEFMRALELNPNYADAHNFYSLLLCSLGRWEEASPHGAEAVRLDPHNFFFRWIRGFELVGAHRFNEAAAQIQATLRMEPSFLTAHWGLWNAFHAMGRAREAAAAARAVLPLFAPAVPEACAVLDGVQDARQYEEAMHDVAELLAQQTSTSYVKPDLVAEFFACAGERGKALDWLERAYDDRRIEMVYLAMWPAWDGLRSEPRFQDLLARMRLPVLQPELRR